MDRKSAASIFAPAQRRVDWLAVSVIALLIVMVLPVFANQIFLLRLEKQLGVELKKRPLFLFEPGRIVLPEASFEYQGRFEVRSGWVEIRYAAGWVIGFQGTVEINGKNLQVVMGRDFARLVGRDRVFIDHVSVEFAVTKEQGMEINSFEVQSKEIQFQIKPRT